MDIHKLDRNSLIALAKSKGIRWASRKSNDELINKISAASEGETSAPNEDADQDSSRPQQEAAVGLDGADGSGEPPAEGKYKKGASEAGDKSGGELMPGSPPHDDNQDADPPREPDGSHPVYDAEVVVHDQLDMVDLVRLDDKKTVARLPLQGLIGRGRTPVIREIRATGIRDGLKVRPGFILQP